MKSKLLTVFLSAMIALAGYNKKDVPIAVLGVKLDKIMLKLTVGDTQQLIVSIQTGNAEYNGIIWDSDNTSVVMVSTDMPIDFYEDGSFIYEREEAAQDATFFLYIVNVDLIKQEK